MAKRKPSTFERLTSGKLNRKKRKELMRQVSASDPGLQVIHENAGGIDVGNASHFAAVPPGRAAQSVREFGCWTGDLKRMAEWFIACGVKTVAMQSTGVYWIAVYDVLCDAGLEVWLVNARETRNLPGRKSDVQESQWLMKLHTYGLLRKSFVPPQEIRALRTIWRLRRRHIEDASREIQHMQKALTTMNVPLANVISDIGGETGQAIIRAILGGQRDPYKLAQLKDYRVRASEEEIASSLEGNWQPHVLFELQQSVDRYDFCQRQIKECDQGLEQYLAVLPERRIVSDQGEAQTEAKVLPGEGENAPPQGRRKKRKQPRGNEPKSFDLEAELTRICGVNLCTIDGVGVMVVQTWVSEVGPDMSPWPTEDNLVSWLKLAPNDPITGGKRIKGRKQRSKTNNRLATVLRTAATSLGNSDSYLGAKFRQWRARMEPGVAVKAMAAHLVRLIYRLLTRGQEWVDRGAQAHENKRRERDTKFLFRKAADLGYRIELAS